MQRLAVVEDLQILRERRPDLGAGRPAAAGDTFGFERGEETFDDRVVPAIARPAHAADEPVSAQQVLVGVAGAPKNGDRLG